MNSEMAHSVCFSFFFFLYILSGIKRTKAVISIRQAKPEGLWFLWSNGIIMHVSC